MKKCPRCLKDDNDSQRFCTYCGTELFFIERFKPSQGADIDSAPPSKEKPKDSHSQTKRSGRMQCIKCNESTNSIICPSCGTKNSPGAGRNQSKPLDAERDYLASAKKLTKSVAFVLGCVLITAGTAGGVFVDFTWLNIVGLAFALVHIVGLWMLVFEAGRPGYEWTLTALSLFKIAAILAMILICIVVAITFLAVLFAVLSGFLFLLLLGAIVGFGYVLVKFYFLALLNVLDGIRICITTNKIIQLEGLTSFMVISYIMIAVSVFVALYGIAEAPWGFLFTLAQNAGILLCLRMLNRFDEI